MNRLCLAVLLMLPASPALAIGVQPRLPAEKAPVTDRLYPELDVQGDGWRGLLPIMLMNKDNGIHPQSAGGDARQPIAR